MRLATAELRRSPRPFVLLTAGLTVLVVLLGLLGGMAQGLIDGFSGVLRAQDADLVVFSRSANDSLLRSRITADEQAAIAGIEGVEDVRGLGVALVGARRPSGGELLDVAVVGYETRLPTVPAPPATGEAYADDRLRDDGVERGDVLEVGPTRAPVEVVGFVEDAAYLLNGGLWVEPGTWRSIQADARPDAAPPPGGFQVVAVDVAPGTSPTEVAARVDRATGTTIALTGREAVDAIPGLAESAGTLDAVGTTALVVVLLVAALFFTLVTVERLPMLAVVRALGAPSRTLAATLTVQALACATAAALAGVALTLAMAAAFPASMPFALTTGRLTTVVAGTEVACLLGALAAGVRLRHVEPAAAIGSPTT